MTTLADRHADTTTRPGTRPGAIALWLLFTAFMVFAMTVIGAITRLTESGLSMVEWRPLIGALPPLSEAEWHRVFDLYRETPEYRAIHSGMSLAEFQQIFFWEWLHRLWGRLIGVVYALPLLGLAALVWVAMEQFGISRREMGDLFLLSVLVVSVVIGVAALAVLLWKGLRKMSRRGRS